MNWPASATAAVFACGLYAFVCLVTGINTLTDDSRNARRNGWAFITLSVFLSIIAVLFTGAT